MSMTDEQGNTAAVHVAVAADVENAVAAGGRETGRRAHELAAAGVSGAIRGGAGGA